MLPIGTEVFLSQVGKRRYKNAPHNPHGQAGNITEYIVRGDFCYRVHWDRHSTNVYEIDDLNPVVVNKELEDYL